MQKSLWFTSPSHIPNIHCSFSAEGESTVVPWSLPPPASSACPLHLAPSGGPTGGMRDVGGRDEVRLEQRTRTPSQAAGVFLAPRRQHRPSPHARPPWKPASPPPHQGHGLTERAATEGTHRRPASRVWPTDVMCLALTVF